MSRLFYLWFLKLKAQLRFYFRKLSSTLFMIFLLVVYGGIFAMAVFSCNSQPMQLSSQLETGIFVMLGFLALLLFMTLLSPKKALFMGEDAYFLFSGPFSRRQILAYLNFQTFAQAFLLEFFVIYMFSAFSVGLSYHWGFFLLMMLGGYLIILTFLILTDYFYLLAIGEKKYKKIPYFVAGLFLVMVVGSVAYCYIETGSLFAYLSSPLFHFLPLFGWLKWLLVGFVNQQWLTCVIGMALLVASCLVAIYLLVSYKGDFYEQALIDGQELSNLTKEAQKGNTKLQVTRIKNKASGDFKEGALAVFSKNILVMKKTGQWVTINDLIVLGIYMVMAAVINMGFGFFVYFLILYIFSSLQQSSFYQELQNYRIYLIPDTPMRKLVSIILPTFIKTTVLSLVSLVLMGIYFQIAMGELLSYSIMLVGYVCIFIASTILSIRILKSRTSQLFENLVRMGLMIVCSLPSIALTIFVLYKGYTSSWVLFLISNSSVLMNFIISAVILYGCKDLMNGRELNSD